MMKIHFRFIFNTVVFFTYSQRILLLYYSLSLINGDFQAFHFTSGCYLVVHLFCPTTPIFTVFRYATHRVEDVSRVFCYRFMDRVIVKNATLSQNPKKHFSPLYSYIIHEKKRINECALTAKLLFLSLKPIYIPAFFRLDWLQSSAIKCGFLISPVCYHFESFIHITCNE